ncbi:MAG: nucleotidyl transferase AbiEii/AbiGii toxin family protein [Candidatus Zixiibacteriota bacterium]
MKQDSLRSVMESLDREGVRFLVAGGLAVNAHGLLRVTADVDLIVQLAPDNIRKAFAALERLGYRPLVPVTVDGFADAKTREGWVRSKGMRVLQFFSDRHRSVTVDVFVEEPFVFDDEYDQSLQKELPDGIVVRFVSLRTLLRMKQEAGRPRDLQDIEELKHRLTDHDPEA